MNAHTKSAAYRRAPQEKRELLLAAARELFDKQGFDATSTQQIARAAGVSEGILFHHFGSKRGLFERIAEDFARDGARAAMPPDREALSEEAVVRAAFDFADAHPGLYRMLLRVGVENGEAEQAGRSDLIVEGVRRKLQIAMAQGSVRPGDPHIMAELQFALVDAAYKAWLRCGDAARREDYIQEAVRCMKAMLAPAGQGHSTADGATHTAGDDK